MPICHNCGAEVADGDKVCSSCGVALDGGDDTQPSEQPPSDQPRHPTSPDATPQQGRPRQSQPQHEHQPQQRRSQGAHSSPQQPKHQGPSSQPPQAQPPEQYGHEQENGDIAGFTRRQALLAGGVVVAAGAGWLVLSGGAGGGQGSPVVIDDFEDGTVSEWNGNVGAFDTVADAVKGTRAGRLQFGSGSDVWRTFEPTTASEFSLWWRSGAISDNEFDIRFHSLSGGQQPSGKTAGFGIEVGAENTAVVAATPPFQNTTDFVPLYENPEPDTWYRTRFFNIDYSAGTTDIALYDQSKSKLGEVTGHSFATDLSSINAIELANHMNFTGAAAYIDHIMKQS